MFKELHPVKAAVSGQWTAPHHFKTTHPLHEKPGGASRSEAKNHKPDYKNYQAISVAEIETYVNNVAL